MRDHTAAQSPQSDHGAAEREGLAPCPFCGGEPAYIGGPGKGYRVECKHCLAQSGWGDYGYQVAPKWNRRILSSRPPQVGGKKPVAWRYRCHDGGQGFVLFEKRLTDVQKARGYYVGEDGDDYAEHDDALGPFYWTEETPLYAHPSAPTAPQEADRVREALNKIAPAVEELACHQQQADIDGARVIVSRQALDEVLNTINDLALTPASPSSGLSVEDGEAS